MPSVRSTGPARVPTPSWRASRLDSEGQLLVGAGQSDSGIALLARAVALVNTQPRGSRRLATINDLAEGLRLSRRMREALPYQREVTASLDSAGYGDTEQLPHALSFLAGSLWELGELAAADSELGTFVREQETAHGTGHVSTLLASLYTEGKLRLGDIDSAGVWMERVMRDTTQGAAGIDDWLPAALTELRFEQGRLADAKRASVNLRPVPRGRGSATALLRARIRRASGDTAGASTLLEGQLRTLSTDGGPVLTHFAMPYVAAGEWRLQAGDARGADSLAQLALRAATADSLTATRSAFAGRADLVQSRAKLAEGDREGARAAVSRALVALTNGYGSDNRWTREARTLADSLSRRR